MARPMDVRILDLRYSLRRPHFYRVVERGDPES
jgi:hypothetical protein